MTACSMLLGRRWVEKSSDRSSGCENGIHEQVVIMGLGLWGSSGGRPLFLLLRSSLGMTRLVTAAAVDFISLLSV